MPPGQPDHMPTRGPASQHVPSTQHEQAFSPACRTNDIRQPYSVQIKLAGSLPHIARKQQCLARVRMSAPECRTSINAHTVRVVLRNSSKSSVLATSVYVPLVACSSGEHLLPLFHGPTVSAQSVKHPALSPIWPCNEHVTQK